MSALQDIAPAHIQITGMARQIETLLVKEGVVCEVHYLEAYENSILGILEFRPRGDSGGGQALIGAATLVYEDGNIRRGSILTLEVVNQRKSEVKAKTIKFPNAKSVAEQIVTVVGDAAYELQIKRMAEARRHARLQRYPVLALVR